MVNGFFEEKKVCLQFCLMLLENEKWPFPHGNSIHPISSLARPRIEHARFFTELRVCVYIPTVNFHRSLFLSTIFLAARRIVGKNNSVTRLENTDWIGSFAVFTTRAHWPILFLKFPRPNSPIPRDPLSPLWIDVVARSRMRQHCTPYTIIFPGARDSAVSPTIHKHRSNYDPFAK